MHLSVGALSDQRLQREPVSGLRQRVKVDLLTQTGVRLPWTLRRTASHHVNASVRRIGKAAKLPTCANEVMRQSAGLEKTIAGQGPGDGDLLAK